MEYQIVLTEMQLYKIAFCGPASCNILEENWSRKARKVTQRRGN